MVNIYESNFESVAKAYFSRCVFLFNRRRFKKARNQSQIFINICKKILKNRPWGSESENYNLVLTLGILFRGLQDYIDLELMTASDKWYHNHKLIERVWTKIWDCRERLEFSKGCCRSESLEFIINRLNFFEKKFQRAFGSGLYLSADIFIKSEFCNICSKEYRTCSHISGRIYNGILCSRVAKDCEFKGGSIVEIPKDPRCRIWPWNMDLKNNTFQGAMLTIFRLDDFMHGSIQHKWKNLFWSKIKKFSKSERNKN